MNEIAKRLIVWKGFGAVQFDHHFRIVETYNLSGIVKAGVNPLPGTDFLDAFPEFVGSEHHIRDILKRKSEDLRLDYVNRTDGEGGVLFFHLLVLPDDGEGSGILVIEDVTEQAGMVQEINQQKYELLLYKSSTSFRRQFLSESFLGDSEAVQPVRETVQKLSKVPTATVLLLGDSGTGKNLVARIIHYSSLPADASFVDINCAALPENLIESELFGYEKGAFTHATASRAGLLEEAEGGTIFLDEIGELPLNLQAKLLSVLETKKFRRLGSNRSITVRARVIAATNRDLEKMVAENKFREDLYYRLNVVALTLPALCDLGEDVLIIADHFLNIFNIEFKKNVKGFTRAARQALLGYAWPGNVRELSNCLERAMIFIEKDRIDVSDLIIAGPELPSQKTEWNVPPSGIVLEDVERRLITSALDQAGGNKSKAARLLGLTRDTLRYRMEKYKLI